ncbi:sensor histidine kinase [Algicella marina]|nr:histidine kinase dimerization/phosphoacceptor domain -containing protein [Algicella marina]
MWRNPFRSLRNPSLRLKMAAVLGVALLPLGVISVVQTYNFGMGARELSRTALLAATERAASQERSQMLEALEASQSLGLIVLDLLDDPDACSRMLANYVRRSPDKVLATFQSTTGRMICASQGLGLDLSDNSIFLRLSEEPRQIITIREAGAISQRPVIVATSPIYREGKLMGYMYISVPRGILSDTPEEDEALQEGFSLVLFDRRGMIIATETGDEKPENLLPADMQLASLTASRSFTFPARSSAGRLRHYAVVPLLAEDIFAISSWDPNMVPYDGQRGILVPLIFPMLMCIVCLIVAYISVDRMIIRPISAMRTAMAEFELGRRRFSPKLRANAPGEMQELAKGFLSLAETVAEDEEEREQALRDKNVLLREVYHRVKNNLQLIVSIMNMQIRNAATPREKRLLQQLQERVMGLSIVHKNLYQATSLASVRADNLLTEVVRQLVDAGAQRPQGLKMTMDFDQVTLYPDQAVPVALLITEAGTNALKHSGEQDARTEVSFSLKREDDNMVVITVRNTRTDDTPEAQGSGGLGTRLIEAFARQLDGELERGEENGIYTLRVRFRLEGPPENGNGTNF